MGLSLVGLVGKKRISFPLADGRHLLGRTADASLKLPQSNVSRHHAEIVVPEIELSWDEVRNIRRNSQDLQSLLFQVLADAGNLLTIPRAPGEIFEPILDLVETALLQPERIYIPLLEDGQDDPIKVAERTQVSITTDALVLSKAMTQQVLQEKNHFSLPIPATVKARKK